MLILEIAWYNKYIIFAIVIFIIAFKVWQNKRQQQQRQQQQLQQQIHRRQPVSMQQQLTHVSINTATTEQLENRRLTRSMTPMITSRSGRNAVTFTNNDTTIANTSDDGQETNMRSNEEMIRNKIKERKRNNPRTSRKDDDETKRQREEDWERSNDDNRRISMSHRRESTYGIQSTENAQNINNTQIIQEVVKNIQIMNTTPINTPLPPKFNRIMDVNEWIKEIEVYISLGNFQGRKKNIYWSFIDSNTREMIDESTLNIDDNIATEEIKQKIRELYGRTSQSNTDFMREFHTRRQQPTENIAMYSAVLIALCKRAYPHALNKEQFILDQFIEGVLNRNLKMELYVNRNSMNLKQAIERAQKWEDAFFRVNGDTSQRSKSAVNSNHNAFNVSPNINTKSSPNPTNLPTKQTLYTNPNTIGYTQQHQSNTNQIMIGNYDQNRQQQFSQSRNNQPVQMENVAYNLRPRSQTLTTNRYDANKPNNQNCYNCNATDHHIRDCPTRRRPSDINNNKVYASEPENTNVANV